MISMQVPSKSETLPVASVAPWDRQTAAISVCRSNIELRGLSWGYAAW